jgi:uncharacterized lipoprotein YddW (UPF0748 family)
MKKFSFLLSLLMLPLLVMGQQGRKPAMMWIDGEANFARFSNPDSIDYYLNKCHDLGFTDVVVDVRPITGEVFFKTPHAPLMRDWQGVKRPDFDYLGRFLNTAHKLGMRVQASLNCFVAGHNYYDRGLIYCGHPEWATTVYTPQGLKPITEQKEKYGAMVDPMNENYRKHIVSVLQDLVKAYPSLDGVLLDRVRYDGIEADFSSHSRMLFQHYIGKRVKHFPEDIFKWEKGDDGKYHVSRGVWFNKWIEWRSHNIYNAMAQLRKAVKDINPNVSFGTYTGAWYPSYYEVGVNFASKTYDPSKDYDWATPDYKKTGYMELLDLYTTGNYYTDISIKDYRENQHCVWNETDSEAQSGDWYCVEGSCRKLRGILGGHKFLGGVLIDQLYNTPGLLSEAIKMNLRESDGLMLFDVVHLINRPELWKEVEKGMREGGELK